MGEKINKHSAFDLAQMQSLPLSAKIRMSNERIKAWYEHWDGEVYIAVSGGKDSQVLHHLVKQIYSDVPAVFVNTGLEFNAVRRKGNELADVVLTPEKSFKQILTEYGYPIISKPVSHNVAIAKNNPDGKTSKRYFSGDLNGSRFDCERYKWLLDAPFRISDRCCNFMKKKPSHKYAHDTGRKAYLGTMAGESQTRYTQWLHNGCNAFETENPYSAPLSFWTENDILTYILENNLDIAEVYGDVGYIDADGMVYKEPLFAESMTLTTTGENRTGCVFCMFGIRKDTERFLRLKEIEPKKYSYIIGGGGFDSQGMWVPTNEGLGYKFVIDWLNEHGNLNIKY